MTTATMQLNNDLNGVELYFDNKPAQDILSNLKSNGFRWSGFKKCWYAKQKENTLRLAEELTGSDITTAEETTTTAGTKTATKQTKKEILPLWELTRFTQLEVNNKLDTKEIAAEVRKHVKNRFPMCKFSVTSTYSSIRFYITSAPFEQDSIYLKAIQEYCTNLLKAYCYCTCYDPYGDYGSSYNFYGSYANIDYDYTQTEQTEEIKNDILDFDNKLAEFEKAEEERKEKEYQEYKKQQEESNKRYQERQQQEQKEIEVINNSVNIIELDESKQYFVIGSEFAKLNKNNTLTEYKEEVEKGEFYLRNVRIAKEVHFSTEEALNYFSNLLLRDFEFLAGKGGNYTEDARINSMTDYLNMTKEERETVIWTDYGIGIYLNNKLQFIVNNEGSQYARYVGLVNNAKIKKSLPIIQLVNNEEITALKEKAESLTDYSVEVITDLNLVKTWNTDNWTEYKEALKTKLKANNFKLTKPIIQQLPEESESLKVAMYKLLIEVDGIQEQFKNADLQQGQKLTLVYMSDFGGIITRKITFDKVDYTSYAQYNNAVKLTYKPNNKRKLYYSYHYKEMLVYNGWQELPETVLNDIESRNGYTITKGKFSSCDRQQFDEVLNYFENQGMKPIVNTYKPLF